MKWNFDRVEDLSIEEIEDAWEAYAVCRDFENTSSQIKFPVLPSCVIDDGSEWEEILNIDLKFGGSFLLSDDISSEQSPTILHLFATMVHFDLKGKRYTAWKADGPVHQAIPAILSSLLPGVGSILATDYCDVVSDILLTANVSQLIIK